MPEQTVDVAVVGAGPAGITAALYAKRKELSVRIFEAESIGGQAALAMWVENYPGLGKMKGFDMMQKMASHLKEFGVEVEEAAEVTGISKPGKGKGLFELDINNGEEKVKAKAVILATGGKHKMLGVPGEMELNGKGVSYCATCDGPAFKGKSVAVVGAGNAGANAALFFAGISKKVYLIEIEEKPKFDAIYAKAVKDAGVELLLSTEVVGIQGKEGVSGIKVKGKKGKEVLPVEGVFVYVGMKPKNGLAKVLGLSLDKEGYAIANEKGESSVPGVFIAGDVSGSIGQIVVAAGAGAVAATAAFEFVKGIK